MSSIDQTLITSLLATGLVCIDCGCDLVIDHSENGEMFDAARGTDYEEDGTTGFDCFGRPEWNGWQGHRIDTLTFEQRQDLEDYGW